MVDFLFEQFNELCVRYIHTYLEALDYRVHPEIDERLVPAVISPPVTDGPMQCHRGPAPGHLTVSCGHMTPPNPSDPGRYWTEEVIPLEAPKLPRSHIAHDGEGAYAVSVDPLARRGVGWDDQW